MDVPAEPKERFIDGLVRAGYTIDQQWCLLKWKDPARDPTKGYHNGLSLQVLSRLWAQHREQVAFGGVSDRGGQTEGGCVSDKKAVSDRSQTEGWGVSDRTVGRVRQTEEGACQTE